MYALYYGVHWENDVVALQIITCVFNEYPTKTKPDLVKSSGSSLADAVKTNMKLEGP